MAPDKALFSVEKYCCFFFIFHRKTMLWVLIRSAAIDEVLLRIPTT